MSPTNHAEKESLESVRNVNTIRLFCARVGPQLKCSGAVLGDDPERGHYSLSRRPFMTIARVHLAGVL
jgi:hypothetical protein